MTIKDLSEQRLEQIAREIAIGCNLDPDATSPKAAEAGHVIPEWMFFAAAAKRVATFTPPVITATLDRFAGGGKVIDVRASDQVLADASGADRLRAKCDRLVGALAGIKPYTADKIAEYRRRVGDWSANDHDHVLIAALDTIARMCRHHLAGEDAANPVTVDAGGVGERAEQICREESAWNQDQAKRRDMGKKDAACFSYAATVLEDVANKIAALAHAAPVAPTHVAEHLAVANAAPAPSDEAGVPAGMALVTAATELLERMSSSYKARNGREVGVQGDDGEKVWLVHSDEIEALRRALEDAPKQATPTDEAAVLGERAQQALDHFANVLFADQGPKATAAFKAAREWWQAEDAAAHAAEKAARAAPGSA